MQLFVANASKCYHSFDYRLRGRPNLLQRKMAPGEQIVIEHEKEQIEAVIAQKRPYGFMEVRDALQDRKFGGIAFSYEPIRVDHLMEALERRTDMQAEQVQDERERAAGMAALEAQKVGLNVTEVEVIEQPGKGPQTRDAKKPISRSVTLDRNASRRRVG